MLCSAPNTAQHRCPWLAPVFVEPLPLFEDTLTVLFCEMMLCEYAMMMMMIK